jgi:hypothetical protein
MTIPNTTYRILVEKLGDSNSSSFVGNAGEIFYDPNTPTLKLSDGSTAGGISIGGTGGGVGGNSYWVETAVGIHTLSSVGIGTTNPQTALEINGVLGFTGFSNVKIGNTNTGESLTTGDQNNFIGPAAGQYTTGGSNNNFFGPSAGWNNTTGAGNNFIGVGAGLNNTYGNQNNFFGYYAAYGNTSGSNNVFIGNGSGWNSNTDHNLALGDYSGYSNAIGNENIFIGHHSGISTSASKKVIIGSGDALSNSYFDSPNTDKDYQFAVGVRTDSNDSKYWLVGDENFNVGIGTTNPTSKLTVRNGDIRVGVNTSQGIILTDANGVAWRLFVNTNGTLGTSLVT